MATHITTTEIENIPLNEALQFNNFVIHHYEDTPNVFDIYTLAQGEESDPDPIFTSSSSQEIANFLNQ